MVISNRQDEVLLQLGNGHGYKTLLAWLSLVGGM